MFDSYGDIVTVDDITEMLNICKSSVYSLLQNNQIRHVKVGRKYVVPKQAVIHFLDGSCYNENQVIDGRPVTKGDIVL